MFFCIKDHNKQCLFKSVTCDFPGCEMKVIGSKLSEHVSSCPFRFVKCEYCGEEEQFNSMEVCVTVGYTMLEISAVYSFIIFVLQF